MRFSFVYVCLVAAAWAAPTPPPPPDNLVSALESARQQQLLTGKPWTRYRSKVKRNSEEAPPPQQIPLPPASNPELVRQWIQTQRSGDPGKTEDIEGLEEFMDQPKTPNAPSSQTSSPKSVVNEELPPKTQNRQEVPPETSWTRISPVLEISDVRGSQEPFTNGGSTTMEISNDRGGHRGYQISERIRQVGNEDQNRFDSVRRNVQRRMPTTARQGQPGERPRRWGWDSFRDGVGQQLRRFQPGQGSSTTTASAPPSGVRQPWYKQWGANLSKFVNRDGPNPQPEVKAPEVKAPEFKAPDPVEELKPYEDWLAKREPWVDEVMKVTNWEPTRLDRYQNELDLINDIVTSKYNGAKWTKEYKKCKEELGERSRHPETYRLGELELSEANKEICTDRATKASRVQPVINKLSPATRKIIEAKLAKAREASKLKEQNGGSTADDASGQPVQNFASDMAQSFTSTVGNPRAWSDAAKYLGSSVQHGVPAPKMMVPL